MKSTLKSNRNHTSKQAWNLNLFSVCSYSCNFNGGCFLKYFLFKIY